MFFRITGAPIEIQKTVHESEGRYVCQFVRYASYLLALLESVWTHILSVLLPPVLFYFVVYLSFLY